MVCIVVSLRGNGWAALRLKTVVPSSVHTRCEVIGSIENREHHALNAAILPKTTFAKEAHTKH
eukprot:scaffold14467_cov112-Skeletonema_dohrnii-CCMP3373.AAC.2